MSGHEHQEFLIYGAFHNTFPSLSNITTEAAEGRVGFAGALRTSVKPGSDILESIHHYILIWL